MIYQKLNVGDKLQKGDEYSTTVDIWREIPMFMVDDLIIKSSTQWRRPIEEPEEKKKKK